MDTYTLTHDQLETLVRASLDLQALEDAGMDNWMQVDEVEWPSEDYVAENMKCYA